jgi:hypothetical protein
MNAFSQTHYHLLRQLAEFDLSKRRRTILELILRKSFGVGRAQAYFPKLEYFEVLTGMSRGNVCSNLGWLIQARVVEECAAGVYAVLLPVEQWRVPRRVAASAAVREVDRWLDLEPAQRELLPEPPSLRQTLRELGGENFPTPCREDGEHGLRVSQRYVGVPVPVQHSAMESGSVPDSGMEPVPDSGMEPVPDSGMERGKPDPSAVYGCVPEMGTPFKALKVQSSKPCQEALNSELLTLKEEESEGKLQQRSQIGNEAEWMARVADLVGAKTMERYGGWYRNRLRENRGKFERVLNAVALDQREGKVARNWGGHFYDLWQRFAP